MYKRPSRRKQLIQRTVSYGLMSAAVISLVGVLLFVVQGYQLNREDGKIEQGGLMQFDSLPVGADVTLDGITLNGQTPTKTTVSAGKHYVTIGRNGYRTWQKSVTVKPGSVVWLEYGHLIPSQLTTEVVAKLPAITGMLTSVDGKWIATKDTAATTTIRLFEISRADARQSTIDIPIAAYTAAPEGKTHQFSLEAWDPRGRYILVKHAFNDNSGPEWLVVDTENVANTKNITTLLGVAMSKVVFSNTNSNELFVQIEKDVRKVDIGAATLSRPLISNVAEFQVFDRMLGYTTLIDPVKAARAVGYYEDGADKAHEIRSFSDDGTKPLHVALGRYFNRQFVAIAYGDMIDVLKGTLPTTTEEQNRLELVTTMTQSGNVSRLSIRAEDRLVISESGADIQTYDVELLETHKFTIKASAPPANGLKWLDEFTAWSDADGMLRLYEFDGTNQNEIAPVMPGFMAGLSEDNTWLYMVTSIEGAPSLTRVRLLL